ncbi:MAG TPA: nitroreductase family protein [Clostridium sp.]|jgi:nitroreductase|uniref:Nitroreductase family protein n=1 Tax=Clostridium lapidicellarium TaxID=3240931 RepID=A0ABV4DS44_9CLOT|nr:nitroreductase family protein [uncultured Clostridium sp.]NLU08370.1 nitroreductase family protein [Clostridiales bacterium]HBC97794.1 nitroreductase family protein [Clostridium sp.]
MNAILERKSIRKYTDKMISKEIIEKILKAGMSAPSAVDEQPWQFIVIDDKDTLNEITKIHPYSQMLKEASHAIVVCGDMRLKKVDEDFWIQDCSAAAENMLVMAQALGLGAVWLGVYPIEERFEGIGKLLKLPEQIIPFCVISLGYPGEKKNAGDRYNPERVHWNKWQ